MQMVYGILRDSQYSYTDSMLPTVINKGIFMGLLTTRRDQPIYDFGSQTLACGRSNNKYIPLLFFWCFFEIFVCTYKLFSQLQSELIVESLLSELVLEFM